MYAVDMWSVYQLIGCLSYVWVNYRHDGFPLAGKKHFERCRTFHTNLGGGFNFILFSPLFGEDSHFD